MEEDEAVSFVQRQHNKASTQSEAQLHQVDHKTLETELITAHVPCNQIKVTRSPLDNVGPV